MFRNPTKIQPFVEGQTLSAQKLEALRTGATGTSRVSPSSGLTTPDGVISDYREEEDLFKHICINENPTTIPSWSMFTLKKDTAVDSGEVNHPYISADIDNPGLIYFTNGQRPIPQGVPFPCRNITSTYPTRIKYDTLDIPILGEECGPTNDGTGKVRAQGVGFVCLTLPDTVNETTWIQELGNGLGGTSWIGVIDQVSVPPCSLTPFVAFELNTPNSGDPTGYCGAENGQLLPDQVINMTGIELFEGALYEAVQRRGFRYPTISPHMFIECLEEELGPVNP